MASTSSIPNGVRGSGPGGSGSGGVTADLQQDPDEEPTGAFDSHAKTPYTPLVDLSEPPSPHSGPFRLMSPAIPIPTPGSFSMDPLPVAGPSSEGALPRRGSRSPSPPTSPSSAPAIPSVIAVAHPSIYIHTQHPRRGSMTPLGLHVISPVAPNPANASSPARSVGFNPTFYAPNDGGAARRGSTASTCSTLTQSRPVGQQAHLPPGFNRERRRSSLSPSLPTLAPPSPTRAHISGRVNSRPTSSDGNRSPPAHVRTRTAEGAAAKPLPGAASRSPDFGRRGSLPQLNYGGWPGPTTRTWNPVLPPPRSSLAEEAQFPEEGYKFGSGAPAGPSAAAAALRNLDSSPESRRASSMSKRPSNAFEEAEADEAEKQRRAFLAATYGDDGRRARERLSFAGSSGHPNTASNGNLRRQSLMLWEKINTAASTGLSPQALSSAPVISPSKAVEDAGPRRGSLPLAIPGGGLGRAPSRRRDPLDAPPPKIVGPEDAGDVEDDEEDEDEEQDEEYFGHKTVENTSLSAPQRPLPPLLPLSDPGPRLLPSTLALHRANHLLNSRNLQADPLPHPLPPSLHPPAPVDLAEFDIDFILAGSQAQLGGEDPSANSTVDVLNPRAPGVLATPTLKLGGDEEDTFAKFVGEFDDEYGGRRGEWTFRACPPRSPDQPPSAWDPAGNPVVPRAEWDCNGAGKYELYPNGDVRSIQTGSVWRIRRSGGREYELEEKKRGRVTATAAIPESPFNKPTVIAAGESIVLSPKSTHNEHGGIKLSSRQRAAYAALGGPQVRVSINDQLRVERNNRLGSTDSAATAKAGVGFSSSLPLTGFHALKKDRQLSHGDPDAAAPSQTLAERGRASISAPSGCGLSADLLKKKDKRSDSRDLGEDDRKKAGGFGNALKRAFKSTLAANDEKKSAREEREREKMQSQSWSPSVSRSKDYIHPSGRGVADKAGRGHVKTAPAALVERESSSGRSSRNNSVTSDLSKPPPSSWTESEGSARPRLLHRGSSGGGDGDMPVLRQGKAWKGVPDEAIAMIVPVEDDDTLHARPSTRQSLLVWFVPFNSETEDRPHTSASSASSRHSGEPAVASNATAGKGVESGSLPKFQKLLRRRASKDKVVFKRDKDGSAGSTTSSVPLPSAGIDAQISCASHPLPFRSFRVVARVVDTEDLRPENETSSSSSFSPFPPSRSTSGARAPSSLGSGQSPTQLDPSLPSTDENDMSSLSTAPTSTILAGRTFPTVIAVCHSRSQGVEFVLEGLDRLGFCYGESAWGPTGYEEWRGSGLSENGRYLLDLLWAGCAGIMGLAAI